MRLGKGIVVDKEKTFGRLSFSALRREQKGTNEDGTVSDDIVKRTYDLRSSAQGQMIQVSLPGEIPLREFDYNAEVDIVNPVVDTVTSSDYRPEVTWFINASDIVIVLKNKPAMNQPPVKGQNKEG